MNRRPAIPATHESGDAPIPFSRAVQAGQSVPARSHGTPRDPAGEVLAAFADVSRRIHDLARELKCLGHFDDGEDRPRAA